MKKTPNVTKVLAALSELSEPLCADVARRARITAPTTWRVLTRLHDEGWVTARADGRRRRYFLTPVGKTWAEQWTRPHSDRVIRVRRKADYVNVLRWSGSNIDTVREFVGADAVYEDGALTIVTPDTRERCEVGDWIIEGIDNFWRVAPHVFHAMFELP